MKIPYFQVNAFTQNPYGGNPAGVCPLSKWLDDETLQAVAAEVNLSETAFFVKSKDHYDLRWFTPKVEMDLCGHATLASALVVFEFLDPALERVDFETRSGRLTVFKKEGGLLAMDFPARKPEPCPVPDALARGLGAAPREAHKSRDLMAVYDSEDAIASLAPDMEALSGLDATGIIATSPGKDSDFVSRFFAPRVGIPEDPVTGSSHSTLIPYWSERLGKKELFARQVSARGGEVFCEHQGMRVIIAGHAVVFMKGELHL